MTPPKKDDAGAAERKAALLKRKIAQADEGRLAMADYNRENQATLDRTEKLKALRLAQEVKVEPPKPKRASKKKIT
jgi:hypothetical protein